MLEEVLANVTEVRMFSATAGRKLPRLPRGSHRRWLTSYELMNAESRDSKENVKQVIEPAGEQQLASRIAHHPLYLQAEGRLVAVMPASLARWFGMHGAVGPLHKGMGKEL